MKNFIYIIGALVLLCGCSNKKEQKKEERIFPVTLAPVTKKDVPIFIEAIGNVYSLESVTLRPQVGGIILEAFVKQGAFVNKGDPLYKIDPRPYEAALDQALGALIKDQAILEFAQLSVKSYAPLVEKDFYSKLSYDQLKANVLEAQGQVLIDKGNIETAKLNLDWTTLISPIDGKISQYNIDPGNLVIANDTNALTTILSISPADIRFNINQKDFVKVQQALKENTLKFEAILPQFPQAPREGKIYFIDNTLGLSTGTILIKGSVENEDGFFWPGEFINTRLQLKIEPQALLVPQEAVKVGQSGSYLYVYNEATSSVELRNVKRGELIDQMILIKEGIQEGEKVVVKGQVNLKQGAKVKVM